MHPANLGLSRKIICLDRPSIGELQHWLTGYNFGHQLSTLPAGTGNSGTHHRGLHGHGFQLEGDHANGNLVVPYEWHLQSLLRILEMIANRMENVDAPPKFITLLTRSGTRTTLLDRVAVPLADPPLPLASSRTGKRYRVVGPPIV